MYSWAPVGYWIHVFFAVSELLGPYVFGVCGLLGPSVFVPVGYCQDHAFVGFVCYCVHALVISGLLALGPSVSVVCGSKCFCGLWVTGFLHFGGLWVRGFSVWLRSVCYCELKGKQWPTKNCHLLVMLPMTTNWPSMGGDDLDSLIHPLSERLVRGQQENQLWWR